LFWVKHNYFLDKRNFTVYIASIQLEQWKLNKMLLNLTNYSSEPIYNQIVQQILLRILNEDKFPGDELESISKISRQHHISKTSVKKAFERLKILGVINSLAEDKYVISDISTEQLKKIIERDYNNSQYFSDYDLFTAELEAAKQIQNRLLPNDLPNNNRIEVASYSTISEEVGGDFYDFFKIEKNKYGFVIGDACGKGLAAAMLISQIQAIIKSDLSLNRSLSQTIFLLNSYLYTYSSAKHFASLFYGILDFASNKLSYINAGHNFPIILNKTRIQRLKTTGPALGIIPNPNFMQEVKKINAGDLIFFLQMD